MIPIKWIKIFKTNNVCQIRINSQLITLKQISNIYCCLHKHSYILKVRNIMLPHVTFFNFKENRNVFLSLIDNCAWTFDAIH